MFQGSNSEHQVKQSSVLQFQVNEMLYGTQCLTWMKSTIFGLSVKCHGAIC